MKENLLRVEGRMYGEGRKYAKVMTEPDKTVVDVDPTVVDLAAARDAQLAALEQQRAILEEKLNALRASEDSAKALESRGGAQAEGPPTPTIRDMNGPSVLCY